ncbi:MAG TPA: endopeptidase La [Polyangiales bacterium]|jgi:ATP-dependent Lon protease|nr:endopeptidase La [Polyangiales bacterium]
MSERQTIPVVPLRGAVVFPGVTVPISIGRASTLRAVEEAAKHNQVLFAVGQRENVDRPTGDNLYSMGVLARVVHLQRTPNGLQVLLEGLDRARVIEYRDGGEYMQAVVLKVQDVPPPQADDPTFVALYKETRVRAVELGKRRGVPDQIAARVVEDAKDPGAFADIVAGYLELPLPDKQELLETTAVEDRLRRVLLHVQRQNAELKEQEKIQSQVQEELGERQREMYLRQQMKAIQKELGEDKEGNELDELRERLKALDLPKEARAEVERELSRLDRSGRESMEAQVIRNYLEWIVELPWNKRSDDKLDIKLATEVLEADHHGLAEVKERVLEFLAVRQMRAKKTAADTQPEDASGKKARAMAKGPILLFVGPPGVGKTSIGKSIARSLGREYVRVALGGVRDEADIRGHRRTYVGAMPGRIVQGLKQAGTRNPVFLLDEIDKLGASYQGNPASALLEVLDPAQNDSFTDHYLGVPFDLSEVLFIATANFIENIPGPLLDRMEVVEFSGYTEREKVEIAKSYLVPRQLEESGLAGEGVSFSDEALFSVVSRYTRESGVRQLERRIGSITRKLARKLAAAEDISRCVEESAVASFLGRPKVRPERANEHNEVGLATGMYYTPAGGDIMFVEASVRKLSDFRGADTSLQVTGWGNVSLILTGQLGDVMKESARAALTYAASYAEKKRIQSDRLGSIEVHIHVPAGAIPKDGPSAGVAMSTALVSAMTGRAARKDVAMTGETTLRGRVLPIGGVKEKVLGAHRAGIKHVILPKENEADLDDLPAEVREALTFSCVSTLDEVFQIALEDGEVGEPIAPRASETDSGEAHAVSTHH